MQPKTAQRGALAPASDRILQLRQVRSAVIVAIAALRHRNFELDEDLAVLRQRRVANRLGDRIGKLEAARRGRAALRLIPL